MRLLLQCSTFIQQIVTCGFYVMFQDMKDTVRLNKYLASAGVASRRGAEALIAEGRVMVNNVIADSPAIAIHAQDEVTFDGIIVLPATTPKIWLYHKPVGLICSDSDPQGRPTIFEHLPDHIGRVMSVGRLDLNSEGLLLLTNDGTLSRYLEHPSSNIPRTYKVRVRGVPSYETLRAIRQGVTIDDVHYQGAKVAVRSQGTGANCWVNITLHEGKNREIRRIFQHFGHHVSRLIRTSYGTFELGKMPIGDVAEAPAETVAALHQKAIRTQ